MEYLTAKELGMRLKASRWTVRAWRKKGMPVTKIGNSIRFNWEEVQEWMKANR